jgi:hypothetical protein
MTIALAITSMRVRSFAFITACLSLTTSTAAAAVVGRKPPSANLLHPRNRHGAGYDMAELATHEPLLEKHVFVNQYQTSTIDFSNPAAVKLLNRCVIYGWCLIQCDIISMV